MAEETGTPDVVIQRTFGASAGAVFDAWTQPDVIRRWLFVSDANEIRHIEVDLRVGGRFSIVELSGRDVIEHFGEYSAVDRPNRLDFTLEEPKQVPSHTRVELQFESAEWKCRLTFKQWGVPRETTESRWERMFDTLDTVLSG